jgi:predicted transcriptional regulator
MADTPQVDHTLVEITGEIVAAYVAHNAIATSDLAKLIADVYSAVSGTVKPVEAPAQPAQVPAVSIRKSVTPNYIVCLEDGKKFKTLKRHLHTLGMTPEQYRAKWNLPVDYPMVAPNYSATRSGLARNLGLGRKAGAIVAKAAPARAKRKVVATA